MFRRAVTFVLAVAAALMAGFWFAFHKSDFQSLKDHPIKSFVLLALVIAVIGILGIAMGSKPSRGKTFFAVVVTAAVVVAVQHLSKDLNISFTSLLWLGIALVVIVVMGVINIAEDDHITGARNRLTNRGTATP